MFSAGVPLVEALQSVAGALAAISCSKNAVLRMRDEVATGQRLQRAMENTGIFPNMVVQMIAVGEESASLARHHGGQGWRKLLRGRSRQRRGFDVEGLLEPLIMAVLGACWSAVS